MTVCPCSGSASFSHTAVELSLRPKAKPKPKPNVFIMFSPKPTLNIFYNATLIVNIFQFIVASILHYCSLHRNAQYGLVPFRVLKLRIEDLVSWKVIYYRP